MLDIVRLSELDYERDLQFRLNRLNSLRLNPSLPSPHWENQLSEMARLVIVEGKYLEGARQAVAARAAAAPTDPKDFIGWFEALKDEGPGQNDPLFPWLAEECSMEQMKWFLTQEVAGLGVIEMTAPGRSAAASAGLKRLGVKAGNRHYFALHAILDIKHSLAWNSEAIEPLVSENPAVATAIAEGALMRLQCGARCFERYRSEFGLPSAAACVS